MAAALPVGSRCPINGGPWGRLRERLRAGDRISDQVVTSDGGSPQSHKVDCIATCKNSIKITVLCQRYRRAGDVEQHQPTECALSNTRATCAGGTTFLPRPIGLDTQKMGRCLR